MTALELIESVEILTQEQYDIVAAYDRENPPSALAWTYLNNIGPDRYTGVTCWLNINVYSEDEYGSEYRRHWSGANGLGY